MSQERNMHQIAQRLESSGAYCVDSELLGLIYAVKDGHMGIISRKNGDFACRLDCIPAICAELMGIYEDCRSMGIDRRKHGLIRQSNDL